MEQHGALASIQAIDSIEEAQYKSSTEQNCCVLQAWNKSTLCHIQGTQRLSCCAYVDCTCFIFCSDLFFSPFLFFFFFFSVLSTVLMWALAKKSSLPFFSFKSLRRWGMRIFPPDCFLQLFLPHKYTKTIYLSAKDIIYLISLKLQNSQNSCCLNVYMRFVHNALLKKLASNPDI